MDGSSGRMVEVQEVDEKPQRRWKPIWWQMGGTRAEQMVEEAMEEMTVEGPMEDGPMGGRRIRGMDGLRNPRTT
ncbi:hypothetical protein PO909_030427 [Leuciscus waleckii]